MHTTPSPTRPVGVTTMPKESSPRPLRTRATDPFEDSDEEIPHEGATSSDGNTYSWARNFFNFGGDREQAQNAQFSDVFEEMMREEGMAEEGTNSPTSKFWGLIGGLSGGALGFIMANFPGMVAGAVAGNRLGAVRGRQRQECLRGISGKCYWLPGGGYKHCKSRY